MTCGWRHTQMLEKLARSPSWIGIDDATDARIEVPVRKASGDLLGDVDLLVRTSSALVIVEYKREDSKVHAQLRRGYALAQLERLSSCFEERLGFRPSLVYAYGPRFTHERIAQGSDPGVVPDLPYVARILVRPSESTVRVSPC